MRAAGKAEVAVDHSHAALRLTDGVAPGERPELVEEGLYQTLFPKSHPYHGYVIGSHADIEAAELDDVREFHAQYYAPNNASLAIVGDIGHSRVYKGPSHPH